MPKITFKNALLEEMNEQEQDFRPVPAAAQ
jgi:hypothetical protein